MDVGGSFNLQPVSSLIGLDLNKQNICCYMYVMKLLNPSQSNRRPATSSGSPQHEPLQCYWYQTTLTRKHSLLVLANAVFRNFCQPWQNLFKLNFLFIFTNQRQIAVSINYSLMKKHKWSVLDSNPGPQKLGILMHTSYWLDL